MDSKPDNFEIISKIRKFFIEFLIISAISMAVGVWSNPSGDAHRKKISDHLKERDLNSKILSGIISETAIYKKVGLPPANQFAIASYTEDPTNGKVISVGALGMVFLLVD